MTVMTLTRRMTAGPSRATLALFPSLGTTSRVWDPLLARLAARESIDVLLFDLPGHRGEPVRGDVDIRSLARASAARIGAERRSGPLVVAGVSMGGAIAVEIARHDPTGTAAFVSFNSALRFGSEASWDGIISKVRGARTSAFDPDGTRRGWFTSDFLAGPRSGEVEAALSDLASVDPEGYVACCRALSAYDGSSTVSTLTVPGLVVGGSGDHATPPDGRRDLATASVGIRYAELPGAHLAIVENAVEAAGLLSDVIDDVLHDTLEQVRRGHHVGP